jgi:hypothetical protein
MSVKFFGQFLIEQGEVDTANVRQALDLLAETNRSLGDVAVAEGMMDAAGCDRVQQAQRNVDKPFGDLAVDLGLLTAPQLVACLGIQRESRMMIGQALVELGYLAEDRLGLMLDQFKLDQAPYQVSIMQQLPDPLANNRIAPYVLDLLPKFAMRMAQVSVKVGAPQVLCESPGFGFRVSLPIHGHRGLEITLVGDDAFCRKIAAATSDMAEGALDHELVADGVGEFLNVLCGNAMSALERDGVPTELGYPDYDAELSDGWLFDLATSCGRAALVLAQF